MHLTRTHTANGSSSDVDGGGGGDDLIDDDGDGGGDDLIDDDGDGGGDDLIDDDGDGGGFDIVDFIDTFDVIDAGGFDMFEDRFDVVDAGIIVVVVVIDFFFTFTALYNLSHSTKFMVTICPTFNFAASHVLVLLGSKLSIMGNEST